MAAVMVLALGLRVFCATTLPFDQDELYTVAESRDLFATKLLPGIDSRPLYYLLQHALLAVLPQTPLMLRLLPILFGTLGVWVTWKLAQRWLGDSAGVAAALFAAISPWHLYASTTARYYSLVYLCSALLLLALTAAYDSESRRAYWGALAALAVGTLTHPSFIIAIAGAVLGLTLVTASGEFGWRWPSRRAWTHLWLPYVVLLLGEVLILRSLGRSSAMANIGGRGLSATLRLIPAMLDWMTLSVFTAAFVGSIILAWRPSPTRRIGVMTISALGVTFILLFITSFRTGVYADYGVGTLPLVFITAGASAVAFTGEASRRLRWSPIVVALILIGSAPSIVSYLSDGMRFDYRPAYQRIEADRDGMAVMGWPWILQLHYAPNVRGYELRPDTDYLNRVLATEHETWAVVSVKRQGIAGDDGGRLADWLASHCRVVDSYQRPRFDYRMYRVELQRCSSSMSRPPE
jgi:4-amino-4-deoxy-L-arabinose transferase-like glycosyltransferase